MANKNDISDLVEFSFFTLIILCGFFVLCGYGYHLAEKKYIHLAGAKVSACSDYIRQYFDVAKK